MNDDTLLDFIEQELFGDQRISFFWENGGVVFQITEEDGTLIQGFGSTAREAIKYSIEARQGPTESVPLSSPSEPGKTPTTATEATNSGIWREMEDEEVPQPGDRVKWGEYEIRIWSGDWDFGTVGAEKAIGRFTAWTQRPKP